MKLVVQLLTWNGAKYIPFLFASLRAQTLRDWELYILDNASSDETVKLVEKELADFPRAYRLEKGQKNLGFAGGHNYLWRKSASEYLMLLNQDLYLRPDCLEKLVDFLGKETGAAAVSPRLMKWDFAVNAFTDKIDSLGLKVYKNRRVADWLQAENWDEIKRGFIQLPDYPIIETFGVSGTAPVFRRRALADAAFSDGGFFDNLYGSYKEDVDLAFRLRSAGHKAFVLSDAVVYHDRSSQFRRSVRENKKLQPAHIKYNSYKNHLMTLYKNEYGPNFVLDFFWISWYEIKKLIWFLLFDRSVLRGWGEIWSRRRELKSKRREIKEKRRIGWREARTWFK